MRAATLALFSISSCLCLAAAPCSYAQSSPSGRAHHVIETPHFRVSYNTGEVFARKRAELFEALYERFTEFFTTNGFAIGQGAGRMKVELLATRREFDDRMRGEDPHLINAEGMYSPERRLAVFYNRLEDARYNAAMREIAAVERDLQWFRTQVARMRSDRIVVTYTDGRKKTMMKHELLSSIAARNRRLLELRTQLGGAYHRDNETTTFHECAHQLANELGVVPRGEATPRWLQEGLAAFFERGDPTQPSSVNFDRLVEYRTAERVGRLVALESLLTDDGHLVGEASEIGYPQAWALTHYLFREHSERMKRYLVLLRATHAEGAAKSARRRLADFRSAFGADLAAFQTAWTTYMDAVR